MLVSADQVKQLRQATGAPMMAAKKALEEADGDLDRAADLLRLAGQASAAKKSDREARNGLIESYVHGGKIGVLVEINCETDFVARTADFHDLAHDIAMQIAASAPQYLTPEDVPAELVAKEKQFYLTELQAEGKPAEVLERIVEGKLDQFFAASCLTKQPFIKNPDTTVEQLLTELIAKFGENIVISRMVRFEMGESGG